jgi:lysylphosphatidylglycerol synthetase-like protein (DUF2156 family)
MQRSISKTRFDTNRKPSRRGVLTDRTIARRVKFHVTKGLGFFDRCAQASGITIAISGKQACCKFQTSTDLKKESGTMLWTILVVLLVLWLLGLVGGVGGSLIHLLLVIAAVVLVINLLSGRRPVV